MTLSQVVALHGGDFDEQMRQRKHEIDVLKELGIVLDTDPSKVSENGNMQASSNSAETNSSSNSQQEELE